MSNQRRLGRGLEALLGRPLEESDAHGSEERGGDRDPPRLAIASIDSNPFQPRRDFDAAEIDDLAKSIQEHGLLQPIVVRRVGERYQLIAGERRLRAAAQAGWSDLPAQVMEADDRQVAELAIVENLQRKDLNPLEKAASFQQYLQRYGTTQEDLAGRLKLDRSTIANLIRLLELPAPVQDALRKGTITQGHARALLPLGDEREQVAMAARIHAEGLSVRATETMVQESLESGESATLSISGAEAAALSPKKTGRRPHSATLEQELRTALGTKVEIRQTSSGRGRIIVHFANEREFERLRKSLTNSEGRASHSQAG